MIRGVEAMRNSCKVRVVSIILIGIRIFGFLRPYIEAIPLNERGFARTNSFWLPHQWDCGGLLRPALAPGED